MGSGVGLPCAGTRGVVMETEVGEGGDPQTLSVSLVPGESSRSP